MTHAEQYLLKKYATFAGIVIVFFAAFFGLSYLRKKAEARYLSAAAEKLCRSYPGFKGQQITILGRNTVHLSGLPFRAVLSASYSGRAALLFMLPITGKYGVYPAVFFYEQAIGCVFCGLAGIDAEPEQAEKYGITHATIIMYRDKIEALMKRQEPHYGK
jgi:hypothetical protein